MHSRTIRLIGPERYQLLQSARVIIFGVGGVGSWCAEALVRSGIGHLTIVDSDCVDVSNLNRQLMATTSTIGQPKVEVLRRRLLDINPHASVEAIQDIYSAETSAQYALGGYDYIVDCIDSLPHKLHLILTATSLPQRVETGRRPVFLSSMGAGRKMDSSRIRTGEFWTVEGCPLARALRNHMKRAKTFPQHKFQCVYAPGIVEYSEPGGTMMHITAQFGLRLAGLLIEDAVR